MISGKLAMLMLVRILYSSTKNGLAFINFMFPNGAMGHVEVNRFASFGHDVRIEVLGSKGQVVSNNQRSSEAELWNESGTHLDTLLPTFRERYQAAYAAELLHFHEVTFQKRAKNHSLANNWINKSTPYPSVRSATYNDFSGCGSTVLAPWRESNHKRSNRRVHLCSEHPRKWFLERLVWIKYFPFTLTHFLFEPRLRNKKMFDWPGTALVFFRA